MPDADAPTTSILIASYKNATMLRECLESVRECLGPFDSPDFEVVLVINGYQFEFTPALIPVLTGVKLIQAANNLGFSGGYNLAAQHARGKYLLLLNDDTIVQPNFLRPLIDMLERHPDVGAVGSLNLNTDGTIGEAGSVIFRDGQTQGAGRDLPGDSLEWDFVRDVEYCSASSLLIPRAVWDEVGGLDYRFHPAYHEDVDLSLRIRDAGYRIVFEPRSKVLHHLSQSTDADFRGLLFRRNAALPVKRYINRLREFTEQPTRGEDIVRQVELGAQRARGLRRHVLFIDDMVPADGLGSGFSRPLQMLYDLRETRDAVSIKTRIKPKGTTDALRELGVRVIDTDLEDYLSRPEILIDAAVISRPANVPYALDIIRKTQPQAAVIMDHEALYHRRLFRQAAMATHPDDVVRYTAEGEEMLEQERRACIAVDFNVCISDEEAAFVRAIDGAAPVMLLEPRAPATIPTPGTLEGRRDLLYVAGWMAGPSSPNADALLWFADEVMPRVRVAIPWAQLRVTGASPPDNVTPLESDAIRFIGFVDDLERVYRAARVVISPIRVGAGVKIKTVEALEYGVPTVATVVGAEGIELDGNEDALIITDDPVAYADALVELLSDGEAWMRQRRAVDGLLASWAARQSTSWSTIIDEAIVAKRNRTTPPLSWEASGLARLG